MDKETKYFKSLREPDCTEECGQCSRSGCIVPRMINLYNVIAQKSQKQTDPRIGLSLEEILDSSDESPNYARMTLFQLVDLKEVQKLPDGNYNLLKKHSGWDLAKHYTIPEKKPVERRIGWTSSK